MHNVNIYCNLRYILELKHSWLLAENRLLVVSKVKVGIIEGGEVGKSLLGVVPWE